MVPGLSAAEGADVVICHLRGEKDAEQTAAGVRAKGRKAMLLSGDIGRPSLCRQFVERTVSKFGRLDILVNNAAEQHVQDSLSRG